MKTLCLLFLFLVPGVTVFADTVEITNPEAVFSLVEVQEEIDFISSAVMGCIDTGREHRDCMCESKAMFSHFSGTVNDLFAKCPELEGHDLITYKAPDGMQVTQSLVGIKKQAEIKLVCSE